MSLIFFFLQLQLQLFINYNPNLPTNNLNISKFLKKPTYYQFIEIKKNWWFSFEKKNKLVSSGYS